MTRCFHKPRVLVDFDCVVHAYDRGWQDGTVYGDPVPGSLEAIQWLMERFDVVIFTARLADHRDVAAIQYNLIRSWLSEHGFPDMMVTDQKLPARYYIDDKAIRFDGEWGETVDQVIQYEEGRDNG
jgi:hypothetical protein